MPESSIPNQSPIRHPVAATSNERGHITVVCDDGSVWMAPGHGGSWNEGKPVPGTRRALELGEDDGESGDAGPRFRNL